MVSVVLCAVSAYWPDEILVRLGYGRDEEGRPPWKPMRS